MCESIIFYYDCIKKQLSNNINNIRELVFIILVLQTLLLVPAHW